MEQDKCHLCWGTGETSDHHGGVIECPVCLSIQLETANEQIEQLQTELNYLKEDFKTVERNVKEFAINLREERAKYLELKKEFLALTKKIPENTCPEKKNGV